MVFQLSEEVVRRLIEIDQLIIAKLGNDCSLNFGSENLVRDFFERCGSTNCKKIMLEADKVWVKLININADFESSRLLNQYRSRMKSLAA